MPAPETYFDPDAELHREVFARALAWDAWLDSGEIAETMAWRQEFAAVALPDGAARVLGAFTRRLNVLSLSGLWCSDSMRTGAILARIAEAAPLVDLRFVERDAAGALMERHRVAGARRVPATLILSEDFFLVDVIGDRSLAHYRAAAARTLGAAAPPALAPAVAGDAVTHANAVEWLERLERAHLLLRLAPMLRRRHGD